MSLRASVLRSIGATPLIYFSQASTDIFFIISHSYPGALTCNSHPTGNSSTNHFAGKKPARRKRFKVLGRLKLKELLEAMAGFQKYSKNK